MSKVSTLIGSEEELKSFLIRMNEENEKAGLKLNKKQLRAWHLVLSLHGRVKSGNSDRLYCFGLQITADSD